MKCIICNRNLKFYMHPFRGKSIFRCLYCTNAYTVPAPKVDYSNNQFFRNAESDTYTYRSYANELISFILKFLTKGILLDVGTGAGVFMEEAEKAGFNPLGIEPSDQAVKYCQKHNLKVNKSFLSKNSFPPKSFDIIVASHVIEHVQGPEGFLNICRTLLKPGGYLCLSQTNYTGTVAKLLGSYWEGWMPNEHLVHFSPYGIDYLLNKSGYHVQKIIVLPLGYALMWKWGNIHDIANNIYMSMNYLISKYQIGFPFRGDQMYIMAKI
jgi:SAM-dependent methyltransferase